MKRQTFWGLLCTICAYGEDSYIAYDCVESSNELVLRASVASPETIVIKKEMYNRMTDDGKYVVSLVFDPHPELMTPRTETLTINSIRKFLRRKQKWKRERILGAFLEIVYFLV